MLNNKTPGTDGFPAQFYKDFWSILSPLSLRMEAETKENSKIPQNMNTATIYVHL